MELGHQTSLAGQLPEHLGPPGIGYSIQPPGVRQARLVEHPVQPIAE
jgi:hypothetical protein